MAEIAGQVGTTPMAWNSSIYNMVHSLSESVIMPIAGVILAFVMTLELIQLIVDKNNMNDVDTWIFFCTTPCGGSRRKRKRSMWRRRWKSTSPAL